MLSRGGGDGGKTEKEKDFRCSRELRNVGMGEGRGGSRKSNRRVHL
jgi:hypothetical protein